MKWTLLELKRKQHHDFAFEETLDMRSLIDKEGDLLDMSKVSVKGQFTVEADQYYRFDLHIETTLTVACAITLDPVEVPLAFDVTETFSEDPDDEYRQVQGITVDLYPIIWSNIYLEKPLRVLSPGATFESDTKEDKKTVNPLFEGLKKYKR